MINFENANCPDTVRISERERVEARPEKNVLLNATFDAAGQFVFRAAASRDEHRAERHSRQPTFERLRILAHSGSELFVKYLQRDGILKHDGLVDQLVHRAMNRDVLGGTAGTLSFQRSRR